MALRDISLNAKNPQKKRKLDKLCDSEKSQHCGNNMDTKDTSLLPSNSNQAASLEDSIILLDDEPQTSDQSKTGDTAGVCVPTTESKSDVPKQSNDDEDDEDIAIMYTKPSETVTYPHPRADCTSHLFQKTDNAALGPIGRNTDYCHNCFCYICDTRASECQEWNNSSGAHCNAHRKADVWKCRRNSRKSALILRLTLEETTQEVRDAASRAQELAFEVTKEYIQYRNTPNDTKLNFDKVKSVYMNAVLEAKREFETGHATMSLVILDEMLRLLCLEKPPPQDRLAPDDRLRPYGSSGFHGRREIMKVMDAILIDIFLEDKIAVSLRRTVLTNMKVHLSKNLDGWRMEDYISLTMRHWDDPLLSPVLHGQNITGKRGSEILRENIVVAKKRLKILEEKKRWQHAARYVKITQFTGIQSTQSSWIDMEIREQLPRFLIYAGKMDEALARLTTETVVQTSQNKYKCVKSSPLSRFSPRNLLVIFKLFSGETPIEPPYPGGVRKILATTQMFRLCLKSLVENQNTWTSLELVEWIIKTFLSGQLCEVENNMYKSYVTMSEMLIASVRTHQPLGVSEDIQPMVWMLSVVKILADAITKDIVSLPMNTQNVITLFIPVFQKNPWLLRHFLCSTSLQTKLETPALYALLIDVYIKNHGIQGLPDQVIERVIARLSVKQVVNFLEAILLHASKPSQEIKLDVVTGYVRTKVYTYALAVAKKRSGASAPYLTGSESENCETVRLLKLISSLRVPYIAQDKHLLMYLALRTFGMGPTIHSLEALQSLCGSAEWPSYKQSCIQLLNNSVIEVPGHVHKEPTVSGSELLELYFKLDAYDHVYKLLESSKCRIDSRAKSSFIFNMVKKENILKLTSLLESCAPANVRIVLQTSRQWLVNELYGPILLKNSSLQDTMDAMCSLLNLVGRLDSNFLVGVLHDAIQELQKKIYDFSMTSELRSTIVAWLKNIQAVLQRCNRLPEFISMVDVMKNGALRKKVSLRKDLCTHFDQLTQSLTQSGFASSVSSSQVSSGDALQTANPDTQCLPMFPSKKNPNENLGKLSSNYSTQPKEPQQLSLHLPLSTAESRTTPHQGANQGQNFQHLLKTTTHQAPNITSQYTTNTSVGSETRSTPSTMSFTQTTHVSSSPVVLQANQHVMMSNQLQNPSSATSSLQQTSQDTLLKLLPKTNTTLPQNIQNASTVYVQSPLSVGSQQPLNQPQTFQAPLIMANNQLNSRPNPVSVQVSVRQTNQQVPITVQRVNIPIQLVTQNQQPQKQPETHLFQRPLIALNQRHTVPVSLSLQIQRPMAGVSQSSHSSVQVPQPIRASNQQVQNQIASTVLMNQPVIISQQQLQQQTVSTPSATQQQKASDIHTQQQQRILTGIQHSSTTIAPHAQYAMSPAMIHQSQQQKLSFTGIHQTPSGLSQQQGVSSASPAMMHQSQQQKLSSTGIHQTPSGLYQQQGVSGVGIPPSPKTILQQQRMSAAGTSSSLAQTQKTSTEASSSQAGATEIQKTLVGTSGSQTGAAQTQNITSAASGSQASAAQTQKTSVGINQARTDYQHQNLFSNLMHHPVTSQQQHLSSFTAVEHTNNPSCVSTISTIVSGTLPQTQNITNAGSTQVQAPTRHIQPNVIGKGRTLDWLNRTVESNFAHQKPPALDTQPEPNSSTQGNPYPEGKHQTQLHSAPNLQRTPKASTSLHTNSQSKPADSKSTQKKRKHKDEESEAGHHKSKRKVNKNDSKTHSAGMFCQKGLSRSKLTNRDTASGQTNSAHKVENFSRSALSTPAGYPFNKYPVVALERLSPKTLRKYNVKEQFV